MDQEKKQKLEKQGYVFDGDLQCFVNRQDGKIFSSEWVEQNNANTLQVALITPHPPGEWKIFLNPAQPHQETHTALFEKYGKTP